jgi:ribosomal protein S12 methylthiotransferase
MKRGRDVKFLRALLARLRDRVPGIAMRTALIVGLPGETEEDFEDLLGFVREQRFERLGVFTYSQEEGTAAAEMQGQIPERVKKARQRKVMTLQQRISRAEQRALVGQRLEVLVEGKAEGTEHLLVGRHARQAPEIDGVTYINEFAVPGEKVAYPGEFVTVEVTEAGDYDLVGKVVSREPRRAGRRLPAAPASPAGKRSVLRVIS